MQIPHAFQTPVVIPDRLQAMDFLKGYAMVWIVFTHLGDYWGRSSGPTSWVSLWRLLFMSMDWVGPTLFIIFTVLGTVISIRNKEMSGQQKGMFVNAFKKSSYIFLIGELINIAIDCVNKYKSGPWHVLGMNMITAVAFTQLLVYGLVKLKGRYLVALFFVLLLFFPGLFWWSFQGVPLDAAGIAILEPSTMTSIQPVIYFIFFHMESMIPAYCWILLSIATVLASRGFVNFHVLSRHVVARYRMDVAGFVKQFQSFHAKKLAVIGAILVAFAVLYGGFHVNTGVGFTIFVYKDLTSGDAFSFWTLSGVPMFLFRHVPHYLIYNLGVLLLHFSVCYWILDIKCYSSKVIRYMCMFGQFSFSIFVYSHGFSIFPLNLDLPVFLGVFALIIVILVRGVALWNKNGGKGSLEWGMVKYLGYVDKLERSLKKRRGITNTSRV